jgi:hypothetical protein
LPAKSSVKSMSPHKLNSKSSMRNAAAAHTPPPHPAGYSPSVPISVYRELAAELQTARVMLDSLNAQNQQLVQQNQQLRVEIERVVQSALQLRQIADDHQPLRRNGLDMPIVPSDVILDIPQPVSRPPARHPKPEVSPLLSDELFTSQEEPQNRHPAKPERSGEVGGFWLGFLIVLIVVSAFGAGFMIMRPVLQGR